MKIVKLSALFLVCACLMFATGCADELKNLRIRNATQDELIKELGSELQTAKLEFERLQREVTAVQDRYNINTDALQQQINALEKLLADKKALISQMQQQLLHGGAALPVELSAMLEDFAKGQHMVVYDSDRGIVKFSSDLLFEKGSDSVAPGAKDAVKAFCNILNTEQGRKFDIIIAGHTDNIRIGRPETKAKHPTNWHLGSHRAIAVLSIMGKNRVAPGRMSTRGFGEYRPIAPNKPNNRGNPQNRRVEIYIVAKGV
ncbi:MAG: OmpA/MotB family protein [Planctomycetota bacterium]|jgi:chemotaxis protein MotB